MVSKGIINQIMNYVYIMSNHSKNVHYEIGTQKSLKDIKPTFKRLFSKYRSSSEKYILKIVFTFYQLNMFIGLIGWDDCKLKFKVKVKAKVKQYIKLELWIEIWVKIRVNIKDMAF